MDIDFAVAIGIHCDSKRDGYEKNSDRSTMLSTRGCRAGSPPLRSLKW